MNQLDSYPITDGFEFASKQRCSLTFRDIVVQEYEALRRSGAFRQKQWLVPRDSGITIPAFDSYEYQLSMVPGSAIWGYTFIADTADPDIMPAGSLSFNVRNGCDDIALFSEVATRKFSTLPYPCQYLTKLLTVGRPGSLNVEICNTYSTAQTGQLVLYGGEPFTR